MAGYAIYIPGARAADPTHLDRVGLADLRLDRGPEYAEIIRDGPDGGRGVMAIWRTGDPAKDATFAVDDKQWREAKPNPTRNLDGGRFWFGVDSSRPTKPIDITRLRQYAGHGVKLADDNWWTIPAATKLPHSLGLNDVTGEFERRIAEKYQSFYSRADKYAVQIFTEIDALDILKEARPELAPDTIVCSLSLLDTWDHACEALSLNYRVTPEIVDFLGLLNDDSMIGIVIATIDLPEINEVRAQKKTYSPVGITVT